MKVVIYSKRSWPDLGGMETYTRLLATGLSKALRPASVEVLTDTLGMDGYNDVEEPYQITRRPSLIQLAMKVSSADCIVLAGPALLPLFLSVLLNPRRSIVGHHNYQACCPNGLLLEKPGDTPCSGHFMAGRIARCIRCNSTGSRFTALIRVLNTYFRRFLLRFVRVNKAITNHVAERHRLPNQLVMYYGIPERTPVNVPTKFEMTCFAFVGRLSGEKGLGVLLHAAKRLRSAGIENFTIDIIGSGELEAWCRQTIQDLALGHQVRMRGRKDGADLEEAMDRCHALIVPSTWEEAAGLSAIEQMMKGKLVIASNIGGLAEVIGDAGIKVVPGCIESLAKAMQLVIANPSVVAEYGRRASARAHQQFSIDRMIADYQSLLEMMMLPR